MWRSASVLDLPAGLSVDHAEALRLAAAQFASPVLSRWVGKYTELEMRNPKHRGSEVEDSFAGTALRISELHKDLLAFQARMEQRFDRVLGRHGRFDKIDGKFERIGRELRGLRADIPKVVRRAVRDARRSNRTDG